MDLDQAQADAVEARIFLDLRIGAAFTRMQTLALQNRLPQFREKCEVVSYGIKLFRVYPVIVLYTDHTQAPANSQR